MSEELRRPLPLAPAPHAPLGGRRRRLSAWAARHLRQPLAEPLLHPSRSRVRALGLATILGHPLFYLAWAHWLPQPWDNLPLRLLMAALGLCLLVIPGISAVPPRRAAATAVSVILWITLPCFFAGMYFRNGGDSVWLASLGAMILIYYQLTDWRLATVGSLTGLLAGWLLAQAGDAAVAAMPPAQAWSNAVVLAFCWVMALVLGLSSSNQRREQVEYTLGTMGIMAHELRTPLATMQLVGDALRNEAQAPDPARLEQLARRLHSLVRNMNHQIDMQITNARLLRLPPHGEIVSAADLVREVLAEYPFRSARERECVHTELAEDFRFRGSRQLFLQVLNNLLKNALRSLAAAPAARAGSLSIALQVDARDGTGVIVLADQGVGMDRELQARIFQPFFSTDRGSGHGLGLAFCQRVVDSAGGTIRVRSALRQGATFTIALPLA
jgi:two-component system CAI-1 autoinducer sensor kinase/phosphatase CqsS